MKTLAVLLFLFITACTASKLSNNCNTELPICIVEPSIGDAGSSYEHPDVSVLEEAGLLAGCEGIVIIGHCNTGTKCQEYFANHSSDCIVNGGIWLFGSCGEDPNLAISSGGCFDRCASITWFYPKDYATVTDDDILVTKKMCDTLGYTYTSSCQYK